MDKKILWGLSIAPITSVSFAFASSCSSTNQSAEKVINEFLNIDSYPKIKFKEIKNTYNLNDFLNNGFSIIEWKTNSSDAEFIHKFNSIKDKVEINFKTYLVPILNNDQETFLVFEIKSKNSSYKKEFFVKVEDLLNKNEIKNFKNLTSLEIKQVIDKNKEENVLIPNIKLLLLNTINLIGKEHILDGKMIEEHMKYSLEDILYSKLSMFNKNVYGTTLNIKENSFKVIEKWKNEYEFTFQFSTIGSNEYSVIEVRFGYEK